MPVHYDIEAAEKEAREAIAKANASLDASVAAGRATAGFAAAQKAFSEASLQLYLGGIRAENLGVDPLTVAHAIGACRPKHADGRHRHLRRQPGAAAGICLGHEPPR